MNKARIEEIDVEAAAESRCRQGERDAWHRAPLRDDSPLEDGPMEISTVKTAMPTSVENREVR